MNFSQNLIIFAVISSYWFVSISLVFFNKYLFSNEIKIEFFICSFQTLSTIIFIQILNIGKYFLKINPNPFILIESSYLKKTFKLSIIFTLMIVLNNLCLSFISVAFYNVARGFTTVFNVIFTFIILNEVVTKKTILCCLLIVVGFLSGVSVEKNDSKLDFSIVGVILGVFSSMFVSLNAIYTKSTLLEFNNEIWSFQMHNNINATILILICSVLKGEFMIIYLEIANILTVKFVSALLLSALFGFLIGLLTTLQIKVTSPLTHNISGTAKACFQTVIAVFYYNNVHSIIWWLSNFMVLFGSFCYTYVRHTEMNKK